MKRLVVTIAIGDRTWGQQALNLCLSVKANDEEVDTAIICNDTAVEGIEELVQQYFDVVITNYHLECKNYRQIAFEQKVRLYKTLFTEYKSLIDDFDEILFLDADQIILPGRRASEWFEEMKDMEFSCFTHDVMDLKTGERSGIGHTFWCEPKEAEKYFALNKNIRGVTPFIPQTDGCWIYFKKGYTAKFLFEIAEDVFNDNTFKYERYKGVKLAELCFNIACAKMGYTPIANGTSTYYPVFLEAFDKPRNEEFIQHQYKSFGFAGMQQSSKQLFNYYDKLAEYYRNFFGIKTTIAPVKYDAKTSLNCYWHICMINNYRSIIKEQLSLMINSGLYKKATTIYIVCVGDIAELAYIKRLFAPYSKIKIALYDADIKVYEFPTLRLMKQHCEKGSFACLYFHTKGVSDPRGKHWRDYLNYFNITKWKDCFKKLIEGYDTAGVKYINKDQPHYSGTFFYARSEYIRLLPEIDSLNQTNRHEAEFWIGKKNPKWASLSQLMIDHFNHEPFK